MAKGQASTASGAQEIEVAERMTLGRIERLILLLICSLLGLDAASGFREPPKSEATEIAAAVATAVASVMVPTVRDQERRLTVMESTAYTDAKAEAKAEKLTGAIMDGVRTEIRASLSEMRQTIRQDIREELGR